MKVLLLYPPVTDPTSGYHSLCYLESFARLQGHCEIEILDTNIEGFHYNLRPKRMGQIFEERDQRLYAMSRSSDLSGIEQDRLTQLWKTQHLTPAEVTDSVKVMRTASRFYDFPQYLRAAGALTHWQQMLSADAYPGQFHEPFGLPPVWSYSLQSAADLTDERVLRTICAPYLAYFEDDVLPRLTRSAYEVIGVNITYWAQLPFALTLTRLVRGALPDVKLIAGGTEVSDVWKYARSREIFFQVFADYDACVVGEGEHAFVSLLDDVRAGRPLRAGDNIHLNPTRCGSSLPAATGIRYESLGELPIPDYQQLPWQLYLSPEPFAYYSPARGCYWNKCTFCDYGLNFGSPTSPWRQLKADRVVSDLEALAKFFKFIYLSVDVLAPATMRYMAEGIVEHGIDIRWGAEIRLEPYWSPERCQLLYDSGCRAVSVGFESGNQRVLDLIDKGTRVDTVAETVSNLHGAGVGVQMMGFTGFATETLDEAMESVRVLAGLRELWTFGGLGEFVLTPGAIAAREPARFGLDNLRPAWGEDIVRALDFDDPAGHGHGDPELAAAKESLRRAYFDRPWLGGVDTPHTLMYHDRYGPDLIHTCEEQLDGRSDCAWHVAGSVLRDLDRHPLAGSTGWAFARPNGTLSVLPKELAALLTRFTRPTRLSEMTSEGGPTSPAMTRLLFRQAVKNRFVVPIRGVDTPSSMR